MRWEQLFDDLAGQLEDELATQAQELKQEKQLAKQSTTALLERARNLVSTRASATVFVNDGSNYQIRNLSVGRDWIAGNLHAESSGSFLVVPAGALAVLRLDAAEYSLVDLEVAETFSVAARVGLSFVLRDLLRRNAEVLCTAAGATFQGKITKIGRDHFDLHLTESQKHCLVSVSNLSKIVII